MMHPVEFIRIKREGGEHDREALASWIQAIVRGEIPDYQISAWLMAVFFRGMSARETVVLTREMMHSGTVLSWEGIPGPLMDKHSTGGVGDKISLPLAPLVASLGIRVPMISGRALGHTGGTLDKLESIPGFRTDPTPDEFRRWIQDVGVAIIGQTGELAPADRKLYALRDATATVESIPLIASSIMSKKLAEGVEGLILDVKTGSGAFMSREEDARELARVMVEIGKGMGRKVRALLTNMDQPLGECVGNALEVWESARILKGEGPEDVRALTLVLAAHMLELAEKADTYEEGIRKAEEALKNGRAYAKWVEMVQTQGGDPEAIWDPAFLEVQYVDAFRADRSGVVTAIETRLVGMAATVLGAGRSRAEDTIDPAVGLKVFRKVGDEVREGDVLVEIRANDLERLEQAKAYLQRAYRIGEGPVSTRPLVLDVLT
jgi:pyrimidine-nucleoside phosphorylase